MAQCYDGLQSDPRMLVADLHLKQFHSVGNFFSPIPQHTRGSRPRTRQAELAGVGLGQRLGTPTLTAAAN